MRTNLFVVGNIESDSRGPARNQSCQTSSSIIIFPLLTTMNLSSFFFLEFLYYLLISVGRSVPSVEIQLKSDEISSKLMHSTPKMMAKSIVQTHFDITTDYLLRSVSNACHSE